MVIRASGLEEKKMPVTRSQKSYAVKRTTDEKSAVSTTMSADATEYASALGATTGGTSGPQPPSELTTETLSPPLLPPCPIVVAGVTTAVAPPAAVSAAIDSVESTSTNQGRSRLPCSSHSTASRARRRELAQARLELLERRKEAAIAKAEAAMFDVELAAAKVAVLEDESEEEQIEEEDETIKVARKSEWVRRSTPALSPQDVVACQVLPEPAGPGFHAAQAAMIEEPRSVYHATEMPTSVKANEPVVVKHDYVELAAAIGSAVARSMQHTSSRIVELPYFNGASTDWLPFKRAFEESEYQLSEQENLARLRRSLRGLAKEAVHCLFVGATTAREVMELLELRFGRPEAIAMAELNKLRSLPKLSANPSDICVFASKIMNVTATIRALEKPHHLYNAEVVRAVVEKMPSALQFQYYRFNKEQPKDQPNLITLTNFFKVVSSEVGEFASAEIVTAEDRRELHSRKPQRIHHFTDTSTASNAHALCPVCKREHSITDCHMMKKASVQERWELAKAHKLCFRCLKVRRFGHVCKFKQCDKNGCQSSHHPMLHTDTVKTTHSVTSQVNTVRVKATTEKVNHVSGDLPFDPESKEVIVSQPVVEILPCLLPPEPVENVVASRVTPELAEVVVAGENRREPQRNKPLQGNRVAPVNSVTSTSEPVTESEGPTLPPLAEVIGAPIPSIDTTIDRCLENREMSVSAMEMVRLSKRLDSPTDSELDRQALTFLADKPKGLPAGETELLWKVVSNSKCDSAVRRLDLIDKRLTDKYWARWMKKYVRDSEQQPDGILNPAALYNGDDRGATHRRRCRERG